MAICPFATLRHIPSATDPAIVPIGAVLHVDAGNAHSLYNWFNGPSGGIESHFHIRLDGSIEQYRDTEQEADANYHGNSFVRGGVRQGFVSIETQGYASGEWTAAQLASIKRLLTWLADTHEFPLQRCPDWDQAGVGYHVMWGAPGEWTPAVGKVCPGPHRIAQYETVIVPWMEEPEMQKIDRPDYITTDVEQRLTKAGIVKGDLPATDYEYAWRMLAFLERTVAWTNKKVAAVSATTGAAVGAVIVEIVNRLSGG